jgi:hypothetical protein
MMMATWRGGSKPQSGTTDSGLIDDAAMSRIRFSDLVLAKSRRAAAAAG